MSINFDLPKNKSNVIKVIGVGGGGSNAINYMYQQGIIGVDFVVCNTDVQALEKSNIPIKVQLGVSLTEGLGAGANPEVGKKSAEESCDELRELLSIQTKMVFITAGMGGGTGTGAAPVIAKMAKEMDILTVGIVTNPFQFEGKSRLRQAQEGIEELKRSVDSLIVINNDKLRDVYGDLGFKSGFAKADEVLATAARGIAEVITHHYTQNIDLRDVKTVLSNSGTAIMGSAEASGEKRAQNSIMKALDSPLLNDNKISGCKNVLLLIVSGKEEITIGEIGEINDYIQNEAGNEANIIMGMGEDVNLENNISVTVIATGFAVDQQHEISNTEAKKVIYSLEEEQPLIHDLTERRIGEGLSKIETNPFEAPLTLKGKENKNVNRVQAEEIETTDEDSEEDGFVFNEIGSTVEFVPKEEEIETKIEFEEKNNIPKEDKKVFYLDDESKEEMSFEKEEEEVDYKMYSKKESEDSSEVVMFNPFERPIEEVGSFVEDQQKRRHLMNFNYALKGNVSKIDEIESQPAYKRVGVDLDGAEEQVKQKSQLTLNNDSNNKIQLRSNNSFLHDRPD